MKCRVVRFIFIPILIPIHIDQSHANVTSLQFAYNQVHPDKMNHFAFISVNCGTQCLFLSYDFYQSKNDFDINECSQFFFFLPRFFCARNKRKIPIYLHSVRFTSRIAHCFASSFIAFPFFLVSTFFYSFFLGKNILCVHSPSSQLSYIPINQVFIWFGQTFHSFSYGSVQLVFL